MHNTLRFVDAFPWTTRILFVTVHVLRACARMHVARLPWSVATDAQFIRCCRKYTLLGTRQLVVANSLRDMSLPTLVARQLVAVVARPPRFCPLIFNFRNAKNLNVVNCWYPYSLWNLHNRVLDDLDRTSKFVEAWHRSIHNFLQMTYPTLLHGGAWKICMYARTKLKQHWNTEMPIIIYAAASGNTYSCDTLLCTFRIM